MPPKMWKVISCATFTNADECTKSLVLWWWRHNFLKSWEDALEILTKFELVFWLQSSNYVADALDDDRELDLVTMTEDLTRNLTQTLNLGIYPRTHLIIRSNTWNKTNTKNRKNKLTINVQVSSIYNR